MSSTLEEICDIASRCVQVGRGGGRGCLLFVIADKEEKLRNLAIKLASKLSDKEPLPIYIIHGHTRGNYGWPFSRIRKSARLRLLPDGRTVTETGGLIFPQDRPIVLLAEYFDHLDPGDQRTYCHLVDGEGGENALNLGSILIGGLLSTNRGSLEAGSASRGLHVQMK